jgi:uncharacterized delta-60 repeat protein
MHNRGINWLLSVGAVTAVALVAAGTSSAAPQDLDSHFGDAGKVTSDINTYDSANAVAIDSHGRIVVAGTTGDGSSSDFLVARYMPDGTLDPSFGSAGVLTTDFNGRNDTTRSMELDSQGRIVVAGASRRGASVAAMARYRPDGDLDPTFSGDGKALVNLGSYDVDINGLAIDSSNRIVIAGRRYLYHDMFDYYDFLLARFAPNGTLDSSFGGDGKITTDFVYTLDEAFALAIDSQNRIVAAGQADNYGESSDFALARYAPSGDLDPSFGGDGLVETSFSNDPYDAYWDYATTALIDGQGHILAAGGNGESGDEFALARYDAGGQLDSGFGSDGLVQTKFSHSGRANSLAIDPEGRIVAVGQDLGASNGQFALARYLVSGDLDPSFGSGGKVTTLFGKGTDARANAAAIDGRGRIVAVGSVFDGSGTDVALARYTGKDRTPPEVTISGPSRIVTRHRRASARFEFASSEPATFVCKLGVQLAERCSSPYRTPKLAPGRHRLEVRAIDDAGNIGTATKRFRIVRKR